MYYLEFWSQLFQDLFLDSEWWRSLKSMYQLLNVSQDSGKVVDMDEDIYIMSCKQINDTCNISPNIIPV